MITLTPQNCWKNIKSMAMEKGFKYFASVKSVENEIEPILSWHFLAISSLLSSAATFCKTVKKTL